ncbi:MAG: hypothetical protein B7X08_07095 [Acidocella sp. 20-63-7]|nr:MAG: hypothetical protein B7X08_07095 [Acidocella sp. 20-63-7]
MVDSNDNTVNICSAGQTAPKTYHHGDLRGALVEAGMRLLEQRQSDDLGLREVAREVGVSATAVYRHFPDKQALLRALAERGFAMMGEMQAAAMQGREGAAAFAAVGSAYVRFALRQPAVFRLMFSSAPPADLFDLPLVAVDGPMRILREQVAALVPPGRPEAVRKPAAIGAWALVHGLAMLALDGMITLDDEMIDAVVAGAIREG